MIVKILKQKLAISIALVLIILVAAAIAAYAGFSDVPPGAVYEAAAERLTALGVMAGDGAFKPGNILSREQFVKQVVTAAGLADTAGALKGPSGFSDIAVSDGFDKYVHEALKQGYINMTPDKKFKPAAGMTFGDACAILVKALGYNASDAVGKARELGLSDKVKLGAGDSLPRWAAAAMTDKFWVLSLAKNKGNYSTDYLQGVFSGAAAAYTEAIVLANYNTDIKLAKNQVRTDKGVFSLGDPSIRLEPGGTYRFITDGSTVVKASDKVKSTVEISVDNAVGTKIYYGETSMNLPDTVSYYYNGAPVQYGNLNNVLKKYSSIVFTYNDEKTGYDYAVIFDPIYSRPYIAANFSPSAPRIGDIDFLGHPSVIRDGKLIDVSQIVDNDVAYQVSDIWRRNWYVLVTDSKAGGRITAVLPDRMNPATIQLDGTNYDVSPDIDLSEIGSSPGSFQVDDYIIALLGNDGKIVDIQYPGSDDNSSYAVVLNANSQIDKVPGSTTLSVTYYAKLLMANGVTAKYKVSSEASELKGKLVTCKENDDGTLSLTRLEYNFPEVGNIYLAGRMLGDSYVASNAKIFNIVSDEQGRDTEVSLLDWDSLPDGALKSGVIGYTNSTGSFGDINVILAYDILGSHVKTAVVSQASPGGSGGRAVYNYTLLIDGKPYQYTDTTPGLTVGSVLKVNFSGGSVESVLDIRNTPDVTGHSVQAVDARRIKLNNGIYLFKDGFKIYYKDMMGTITVKSLADIAGDWTYGTISLYLDNNGRVDAVLLTDT